ncbi:hypothetical protein PLESTB_001161900 [Pleodorina starrii]|uniref:Dimethylargininase n=1 Tax=Pleodorina starrii TaxID=330485 RepID=A0A9W6BS18_9CHLO|nr:hypothetical protein PLESTM_000238100 [Pleodorina starrii]GLC56905.1 hypothetical protein PLESTB_001161900 [Pleodorina starrii]GLC64742.1 hypothetical protein PLESTF_000202600 [Pleodorina starrii]
MKDHFVVTHALTRGLAQSFENALALEPPPEPISVAVAQAQHNQYNELLRTIVPNVVELAADESCPDCVFIEDTALVISDKHAVITRPGAPSRQPEPGPIADALRSLGIPRIDTLQAPATLDGGDVLVLPWAVLVGTSRRTNDEAVSQLKALLKAAGGPPLYGFSVTAAAATAAVDGNKADAAAHNSTLHFKSVLSALDPHTLLVADSPMGRALADQIRAVPELSSLEIILLPDTIASNVLSAGRHVVMQAGFPASQAIVAAACAERGLQLHTLSMSELAKADGALTCCSLLFAAPKAAGAVEVEPGAGARPEA